MKSIPQIQKELQEKKTTVTEIVNHFLSEIETNKHLNIFIEVFSEDAKTKALEIQDKVNLGKGGKLAGIVIGIKDNICYKNHHVSASSKILENFESIYSSTVVERLLSEDAIIIGRLNCDEFAMGSSNENSVFGAVKNPINPDYVPGGSSGGSAAAVAAGLCHAALGTDTGGSIRQPASFTWTVGLKPTYGRVSRHGIIAYASSFDQVGPITNSVVDAAIILEIIAGKDEFDSTASQRKVANYSKELNFSSKTKIAVLKECIESKGLNAGVKNSFLEKVQELKSKGHEVEIIDFPFLEYLVPCYYVLTTAEASSNLSRYDGIHFGYRSKNAFDLESTYKKSRTEGFGKEVKRRIMLGTFVLSAGYYDAYYAKAQKVRRILRNKLDETFKNYQFILIPTTPNSSFKIGQKNSDPIEMYLEDIFTVLANLAGNPAISVPLGKNGDLPFGIQLMAKNFDEQNLLSFSNTLF
jgi:aspartyl-tRNA(Asn)/glutamyl-tRNA(Gln) amidotransferase subunit A